MPYFYSNDDAREIFSPPGKPRTPREEQLLRERADITESTFREAKPKLGTGARFKALTKKLNGKVTNPAAVAAVAASIGRKKYGKKRFAKLGAKGRKAASK